MLESLFSKVAGLEACFPMNFAKLLRTFLTEQLWWLLLIILSLSIYIYREREREYVYVSLHSATNVITCARLCLKNKCGN